MRDILKRVGGNIRKNRLAKKWSQERLALESGLHRAYIGQIERGEKNIGVINLFLISGALKVSTSRLVE